MTHESLPRVDAGKGRLARIEWRTCPGSQTDLILSLEVDGTLDAHGVCRDAWWTVRSPRLPDRHLRLRRGSESLQNLLHRYAFTDVKGCAHHKEVEATYVDEGATVAASPPQLPSGALREWTGVPQFYPDSGICWFAALCGIAFGNVHMKALLSERLPPDLAALADQCLVSREAAQALRNRLWYEWAIGDNVDDPPHMDGRNGCSELRVLLAKLKLPGLCYRIDGTNSDPVKMGCTVTDRKGKSFHLPVPKRNEACVLLLRFQDAALTPLPRRIKLEGRRFRLTGVFLGQRKCGHQIGMTSPSGNWRDWCICDADLHKSGIGPLFVNFQGPEWSSGTRWWDAWRELIHVTKFGMGRREFCIINPHNESDARLDAFRSSDAFRSVGSTCVDAVFVSDKTS